MWWSIAKAESLSNRDSRLHTRIEGRVITVFRDPKSGALSAIDSVCAHAGGNLTDGVIQDIEELNLSVVLCPLHRYMYAISPVEMAGAKVYQALEFTTGGKPGKPKWTATTRSASCQRSHIVTESSDGMIYIKINKSDEFFASDKDATSDVCAKQFSLHQELPIRQSSDFEP